MVKTYTATIALGLKEGYEGIQHPVSEVLDACKEYCEEHKLCVSITPTTFCYPGGSESGCFVQLIQYPRFIIPEAKLLQHAKDLACLLRAKFNQIGVTIITTNETLTFYDGGWIENVREECVEKDVFNVVAISKSELDEEDATILDSFKTERDAKKYIERHEQEFADNPNIYAIYID